MKKPICFLLALLMLMSAGFSEETMPETEKLPLSGLVIGINPGHQSTPVNQKVPVAPGSGVKKSAVGVGGRGDYTGVYEYETNLQVSLMLCGLLTELGAEVVMTRTDNDAVLTNIERAQMLNGMHVDMAIQVHCDDSQSHTKSGVSAYYPLKGAYTEESRQFAEILLERLASVTGAKNRGAAASAAYISLNYSETPSVLIEMGYLSNKNEDRLLADDGYRALLAQGMLEAIAEYFGRELP